MKTLHQHISAWHELAVNKGWWDDEPMNPHNVAVKLALVHAEVSEALEALRNGEVDMVTRDGKPEGAIVEIADAIIRLGDLAEAMRRSGMIETPLAKAIEEKHRYNATRSRRHGGKVL